MRIAIVGSGALGLFYGARLLHSEQNVHFLLRRDYEAIRSGGLQVYSVDGDFHLDRVNSYRNSADIGPVDLVLVGLKTFCNDRAIDLIEPLVSERTTILTLQNGLGNEELLAKRFGEKQIMGGVAFLCANRGEPGTVHHLGQGAIRIGNFSGGHNEKGETIATAFRQAGISCEYVDDLKRARWEKLVWNIPFNGLTALTGKCVTDLLAHPPTRQLAIEIMREVVAAANAQSLSAPIEGEPFIDRMIAATETMDGYRPSMMIDRLEGRPLELEAIYALPLKAAGAKGIAMPRTEMLHSLLDLGEPPA
ncbi:MAG: 2-dehydropantoate 2-reductase [Desulfuromonas sp.]|nr:MAG: 2-dehydropantoate 2-reductase [Desulfuromonas sp.]